MAISSDRRRHIVCGEVSIGTSAADALVQIGAVGSCVPNCYRRQWRYHVPKTGVPSYSLESGKSS